MTGRQGSHATAEKEATASRSGSADGALAAATPASRDRSGASLPLVLRLVRATAILPVILLGIGSLVSYGVVLLDLVAVGQSMAAGKPQPSIIVELVRVVDISLVGMLMSILAFGVYELFVTSIDWPFAPALIVRDFADLERRVAQTVSVILAVTALDLVVEPAPDVLEVEVVGAIALAIVAIAVYLRLEPARPPDHG